MGHLTDRSGLAPTGLVTGTKIREFSIAPRCVLAIEIQDHECQVGLDDLAFWAMFPGECLYPVGGDTFS